MKRMLPWAAVACLAIRPALGAVWYADAANGNDRNSGASASAAFRTIGMAMRKIASGDTVLLETGTYQENVNISVGGTSSRATILRAASGAHPVIIGPATAPDGSNAAGAVNILAPYVTVAGLDVTSLSPVGAAIRAWGETPLGANGISRPVVHHLTIVKNITHDAGSCGIGLNHVDYVNVRYNVVYNNAGTDPNQCSGISLFMLSDYDSGGGFRNVVADNISCNNIVNVPAPGESYTTDGNGIIIDSARHQRTDNVAYRGSTLIYGNIVCGNGARGIVVYESDNVTVSNNTAYFNQQSSMVNGIDAEISSSHGGSNIFENNIAYSQGTAYPAFADTSSGDRWDYNITVGGGSQVRNASNISIGTHNLTANSLAFVSASTDPTTSDFHLVSGDAAIGAGKYTGFMAADRDGHQVLAGTIPNMGAYTH